MTELDNVQRIGTVAILGVFVADAAYRATRQPAMGETVLGSSFALGPGGKGSNQAVAAARCHANVSFISCLGEDAFAQMAFDMYQAEGITAHIEKNTDSYTGSAYIFIDENTGNNAIIVCPGAAMTITPRYIDTVSSVITEADVFVTQLEQPIDAAMHALSLAKGSGVTTILNTAPAEPLDDAIFKLCDYVTPNETEVEAYTGVKVMSVDDAKKAGEVLLAKGVGTALITLGEQGALLHNREHSVHIPAVNAGAVVETTGAGDAFNGGFAAALAQQQTPLEAARFACAVAGLSVTRAGTAPSMPTRTEVENLLAQVNS
ncbi:MAG: ribokinase [Gammaproteobacteria bacterium]|nr:ribokinase [Gammaproteobacteria bacterium]